MLTQKAIVQWLPPLLFAGLGVVLVSVLFLAFSDATDFYQNVLGWATLVLGFGVVFAIAYRSPQVAGPLLVGFVIRTLLALYGAYVGVLPYSRADALAYEQMGWEFSKGGLFAALFSPNVGGETLYVNFIAVIYALTSRSVLMLQAVNVLFGSLVVWNVYATTNVLWGKKIAKRSAWMVTFFPSLMLFSAITLREVAVVYFLSLGLVFFARWYKYKNPLNLIPFTVFTLISAGFHSGVVVLFGTLILQAAWQWLTALIHKRKKEFIRSTVILACVIALAIPAINSGWGLQKFTGLLSDFSADNIGELQETRARDRAAYLQGLTISNPVDIVWQTPIRMFFFLYTPFPWMVSTGEDVIGLLDAVLYVGFTISIYRSRQYIWKNQAARTLLLLLLTLIMVFSLGTSNYGTALRHRAKFMPLFASLSIILPWENKRLTESRNPSAYVLN